MYSIRQISRLFLLTLMMLPRLANAELKYEQKATLSTFESQEAAEKMAQAFRRAAEGDLNIKIMNIKYEQEDKATFFL